MGLLMMAGSQWTGTNRRSYMYDGNGNVMEVVDSKGVVEAHYEYDPYGNVRARSGAVATNNPFRFSTKYADEEMGLVYYGYRFYSPELGRWVSRDPVVEIAVRLFFLSQHVPAKEQEISKWQKFLTRQGFLDDRDLTWRTWRLLQDPAGNLYLFVENVPVFRLDMLGLADYCGSAGNSQYVPELWFGGENGPCHKHDQCYGTCGYSQEYCNGLFFRDMLQACPLFPPWETATCVAAAAWYYAAVQNLGRDAFCKAQKGCCPKGEPIWGSCP